MGSADPGEAVTVQPTTDTKRKVSIQSDPVAESRLGYDNLGYDLHPRRKISQVKLIAAAHPMMMKMMLFNRKKK